MCTVKKSPADQTYITEDEQRKCRKVADAFTELEQDEIVVVDAGKFGFVKLQYYTYPTGFEDAVTFTDSGALFEDLWEEWLHSQLIILAREMGIRDIDYDDVFSRLSGEKKAELMEKRQCFKEKSSGGL